MQTLWSDIIRSRAFWVAYLCAGVDFAGCPSLGADADLLGTEPGCDVSLTFGLPGEHMLRLRVFAAEHLLEHLDQDDAPQLLGTMDGHQMSDVFRWEELGLLTRHLTRATGPAWAIELLLSFYVAVTADCAEEHAAMLRRSLTASGVFGSAEVDHVLAYTRRVAVREDFRWVDTPGLGWVAEGRDAYCLRHPRCDFDFARFDALIAAVRGA